MRKVGSIAHDALQAEFTSAFRQVVGTYQSENKAVTVHDLAVATGIKQRTLEAYRDGEMVPRTVVMLHLMAALPGSFTNRVLALAGMGQAIKMTAKQIDLHCLAAEATGFVATHAEHMRDGRLDHREVAAEIELARAMHSTLGDFIASNGKGGAPGIAGKVAAFPASGKAGAA
jgi:hypothetical protein